MSKNTSFLLLFFLFGFLVGVAIFIPFHSDLNETIKEAKMSPPQEFTLLSASIENRPITNSFGGVIRAEKYFHYSFETSSGEVLFKNKKIHSNYEGTTYILEFQKGDENKILQYDGYQTKLVFIMTDEMYKKVFP